MASAAEQLEISETADAEKLSYDQNAATRIIQYDENHTTKLGAYNANDEVKIEQYNENHVTRLIQINDAYAGRIIDMLRTQNLLGAVDEFIPQVTTQQAKFLSTSINTYLYYKNGVVLATPADYTVFDDTTIDLVVPVVPGDVVIQVGINLLADLLIGAGQLTLNQVGVPNGVAGLDENARVPSAQLPSYVDDVLEFSTLATFPATGETGKIYVALDTNKTYRWAGTVYVYITSGAVDSVAGKTGVVTLVKSDVGLSNVDNTADSVKAVLSSTKLATARAIALTGDVTGTANFDGSAGVSITATVGDNTHSHGDSTITDVAWSKISSKPDPVVTVTLTGDVTGTANATLTDLGNGTITVATTVAANSVALGTDTTGNYAVGVTAGAGITVTGTAGEGWSPTIAHADTSSATSIASNNSNGVVIQDVTVTLDTYGHATAASVGTVDLDTRYMLALNGVTDFGLITDIVG